MKKAVIIIFLASLAGMTTLKAQSVEDVFTSDEVVWFGLDFSEAKMIGPEGFSDPFQIVNRVYRSWNNLIINEPNRYNIKQSFRKRTVHNDLSVVTPRNTQVDPDELVLEAWETHELSEEIVQNIISEYETDHSGLGLVFIIESFNKATEIGTMYVTFFDIESKKVLLTKKMQGETGGFGFRNHWARTIRNVIEESGDLYPDWRRKHTD